MKVKIAAVFASATMLGAGGIAAARTDNVRDVIAGAQDSASNPVALSAVDTSRSTFTVDVGGTMSTHPSPATMVAPSQSATFRVGELGIVRVRSVGGTLSVFQVETTNGWHANRVPSRNSGIAKVSFAREEVSVEFVAEVDHEDITTRVTSDGFLGDIEVKLLTEELGRVGPLGSTAGDADPNSDEVSPGDGQDSDEAESERDPSSESDRTEDDEQDEMEEDEGEEGNDGRPGDNGIGDEEGDDDESDDNENDEEDHPGDSVPVTPIR